MIFNLLHFFHKSQMKYDFSDDKIFAKGLGDMIYFRADAPRYKSCFLLLLLLLL